MKILYINVIEQNAIWGAENFVNKGFISLGHNTINIDYRNNRNKLSSILKKIPDFDVLFLQRGDRFPLYLLKSCKKPKFFWATELVSRNRDQDRLLKSNIFNHVFVHSEACKQKIIKNNWVPKHKISIMLNGFDPEIHLNLNKRKNIDLLFVGSSLERRRKKFKELSKHFNLEVYNVFGDEMINLFNRAKIVLNIHAENSLDTETRVFEALGCGAFLISEKLSKENPFIPNEHYIETNSLKEMIEKITFFLKNKKNRDYVADKGYKEAISKHTYTKRAEEFITIFKHYNHSESNQPYNRAVLAIFSVYEFLKRKFKIIQGK